MKQQKIYYKRHLPHYQIEGYTYFITIRLANSLPIQLIRELQYEKEAKLKQISVLENKKVMYQLYREYQQNYFEKLIIS